MPKYYCENPSTPAEWLAAERANLFESILSQYRAPKVPAVGPQCAFSTSPITDTFLTNIDQEFSIDGPVLCRLLPQLVESDPKAASVLVAVASKPPADLSPRQADDWLVNWLNEFQKSTIGGGNIAGNFSSTAEAALRRHWRLQATKGFDDLIAGNVEGKISLSKYIHVTTHSIGKGGDLRKGAKIIVRLQGQPTKVVQQLKIPYAVKSSGQVGVIKANPRNVQLMKNMAVAVADSRAQASTILRNTSRFGGAALAFGPSAAIDFYEAYTKNDGASAVGRDFLLRSAGSQSGNAIAMGAGIFAVAAVGAVGAPAIVIGLFAGIVVQTVWGATGMDKAVQNQVRGWID